MLAEACVGVATHRHGCCVLQRAIDAATVEQSRLLVSHVSRHALQLMQVGGVFLRFLCCLSSRLCIRISLTSQTAVVPWFWSLSLPGTCLRLQRSDCRM